MDFYTVSYVESQITSGHTLGFVIFVVVLLALLGVGIQVLRNGFTSRYRDLTVILSLVIVFFLGNKADVSKLFLMELLFIFIIYLLRDNLLCAAKLSKIFNNSKLSDLKNVNLYIYRYP